MINKVTFKKVKCTKKSIAWGRYSTWCLCVDGNINKKIFIYDIGLNNDNTMVYLISYYLKILPPLSMAFNHGYFETLIEAKKYLVDYLANDTTNG